MSHTYIKCPLCGFDVVASVRVERVGVEPTPGGDVGYLTIRFRDATVRHTCRVVR